VAAIPTNGVADDPRSRVAAVVVRHERALLRVARQASLCDDDAHDAYQRALEIFVRRVETVDPATEVAWLKVVVRHEAMAIRRARSESVTSEDIDLDELASAGERSVEDVVASGERVRRSAEALRALKPDEAAALMMKAHGLSYEEIGERNGWTYTKVNRAITEGRRRFLAAYEEIESGAECARFAGIVEALAAGQATASQIVRIRPHLRHCVACRAAVRDLHLSRLRRATLFWPVFLLASSPPVSVEDRLRELAEQSDAPTIEERLRMLVEPGSAPAATPDAAVPLPQAGELGVQLPLPGPPGRLGTVKHHVSDVIHRTQASDVATGIQIATSGGGGRLATIATILGLCLSGAGVGTVCVVSGVVSDPFGFLAPEHAPRPRAHGRARPTPTPTPSPVRVIRARATTTPTPTATPRPRVHRQAPRPARTTDPSQGTTPTSHENAPISPAPASASGTDTFTPEVPQSTPAPAPPPATGGDEFTP
jgi:RNA polymerase sigma factor (sigma-70 family)